MRPDQVNIDASKVVLDEVVKARKQVKEETAPGEDGIMPEVLHRINIDDIILEFANKLLEENELPEQFSILNLVPLSLETWELLTTTVGLHCHPW